MTHARRDAERHGHGQVDRTAGRHWSMLPRQRSPVILRHTPMNSKPPRRMDRRWPLVAMALVILFVSGFTIVRADVLGMGERFDRWATRVAAFIDPPPD